MADWQSMSSNVENARTPLASAPPCMKLRLCSRVRAGAALFVLLALVGCRWFGGHRDRDADKSAAPPTSSVAEFESISPDWISDAWPEEKLDSLAAWRAADGAQWLIVSAKGGNRLRVLDSESGALLQTVGGEGERPGAFRYPNGLFVLDNLLLVVERDNHRIQVLRLPDFLPLATFGEHELRSPYGIWARALGEGEYEVLVTDSYMSDLDAQLPPALPLLDQRIKRYRMEVDGAYVAARLVQSFGDTSAAGALRMVESIAGDPANARLLIAEEDARVGTTLRVYSFAGDYSGRNLGFGTIRAQAEGIALWACADGSGYWIAADQFKDRSVFHVFDRLTLAHKGAFASRRIANTDGIWMQQAGSARFPNGALFAVHDDRSVAAIAWPRIAIELNLRLGCE